MAARLENGSETHKYLSYEYEQINENFRFLADVRFKLLALIPPLGGVGIFILSNLGLNAGSSEGATPTLLLVSLASIFGLLVTLGITLYDQRNSELYNALIHRAKYLEKAFQVPSAPAGLKEDRWGGQFRERPDKSRRIAGITAAHDVGLALIYGPVMGAWLFPVSYSVSRLLSIAPSTAAIIGVSSAVLGSVLFAGNLVYLDGRDRDQYHKAAERDGLVEEAKGQGDGSRPEQVRG